MMTYATRNPLEVAAETMGLSSGSLNSNKQVTSFLEATAMIEHEIGLRGNR